MNILKPQEKYFKELEAKQLKDVDENTFEEGYIRYSFFENENCSGKCMQNLELEKCKMSHIVMQNAILEKMTFKEVKFENCDFSNTDFIQSAFLKCEFKACKLTGADFCENRFYHVTFLETNANYLNLSLASMEHVLFQEMEMRNCYFQETKIKNIYFEKVDLSRTQFFKTSLYGVDLSSSNIEKIAISIEDIKGATIEQFQAIDLLYLLGVKVK